MSLQCVAEREREGPSADRFGLWLLAPPAIERRVARMWQRHVGSQSPSLDEIGVRNLKLDLGEAHIGGEDESMKAWCIAVPDGNAAALMRRSWAAPLKPMGTMMVLATWDSQRLNVSGRLVLGDSLLNPTCEFGPSETWALACGVKLCVSDSDLAPTVVEQWLKQQLRSTKPGFWEDWSRHKRFWQMHEALPRTGVTTKPPRF